MNRVEPTDSERAVEMFHTGRVDPAGHSREAGESRSIRAPGAVDHGTLAPSDLAERAIQALRAAEAEKQAQREADAKVALEARKTQFVRELLNRFGVVVLVRSVAIGEPLKVEVGGVVFAHIPPHNIAVEVELPCGHSVWPYVGADLAALGRLLVEAPLLPCPTCATEKVTRLRSATEQSFDPCA